METIKHLPFFSPVLFIVVIFLTILTFELLADNKRIKNSTLNVVLVATAYSVIIVFIANWVLPKPECKPKIDLPEEYKCITRADNLRGYFDKDSILHIEFNNHYNPNGNIKFIWNDDISLLPPDGSNIKIEFTDEDTVFLGLKQ